MAEHSMQRAHWLHQTRKLASGVLLELIAMPCCDASEVDAATADTAAVYAIQQGGATLPHPHLRSDDRLDVLFNHPAFRGFSQRILPRNGPAYDESMPLSDVGKLLPYHSHASPAVIVDALNRIVDDANPGRTVFYDFHTEVERQINPALEHTGLFFFRGKPGAPFAVIAPDVRVCLCGLRTRRISIRRENQQTRAQCFRPETSRGPQPDERHGLPALYGTSTALEKTCGPVLEPGALKSISTAVPKCSTSVRGASVGPTAPSAGRGRSADR